LRHNYSSLCGLATIGISACAPKDIPDDSSAIVTTTAGSESTLVPALTPSSVPTYAPGTELFGMLSVTGKVVIEPKYENLDLFSEEGLARFEDHGLWGFVNEQGKEVIPAQYEVVKSFVLCQ
jgi:hypothetical protein